MKAGVVRGKTVSVGVSVALMILAFVTPAFALEIVGLEPSVVEAGSGDTLVVVHLVGATSGVRTLWVGGQQVSLDQCMRSVSEVSHVVTADRLTAPGVIGFIAESCTAGKVSSLMNLQITGLGEAVEGAIYFVLGALGAWAFIMGVGQRW